MDINRRQVLRRIAQAAAAGSAGTLAAAGPPRHVPASPHRVLTPAGRAPASSGPAFTPTAMASVPGTPPPPPPPIVPRTLWLTNEAPGRPQAQYDRLVRAVFIHHTNSGNSYEPQDVPGIIRSIYRDHRERRGWDDIGYSFMVDRFGTIYEGRQGGVDQAVVGAHTKGFNHETVGIAAIGTYRAGVDVPAEVLNALAGLAAWKLGAYGVDPRARTELTSTSNESRFRTGTRHTFSAISGHRDAVYTQCPGDALYAVLPQVLDQAADLLHSASPASVRAPDSVHPFNLPAPSPKDAEPPSGEQSAALTRRFD